VDTQNPTVGAGQLYADESACTGIGGTCIIGDTITFSWRNDIDGNTDEDFATVFADLTNFGSGAQLLYDDGSTGGDAILGDDIYTYAYTVLAENDDGTNSFSLTVADLIGNSTGPVVSADTAPVDNIAPTIGTPGSFAITLDVNVNGVADIADTVTYSDGVPGGIADGDTWTVDITTLTGNAAATNAGSPYAVIAGALTGAIQFTETVTDNAGNTANGLTSPALNVYNIPPGTLTGTSVTPASTYVNTATSYTVAFTTAQTLPGDGIVEVTFPAQFDVSGLDTQLATSLSNIDGTLTAGVVGQVVTFTRAGGTPVAGVTAVSFVIATGTNGPTAGGTGTFAIQTLTGTLCIIDKDLAVPGVILRTAGTGGGGGGVAGGTVSPPADTTTTDTTTAEEPAAEEEAAAFTDIDDHWGETYIDEAHTEGYVEGYDDNTFKPDQYITRAEIAKLVAMWLNMDITDDDCNPDAFSDVSCSQWYGKYISYLFLQEIVEGYDDGTYGPGKYVSRAEALKVLIFAKMLQDTDMSDITNPFTDVSLDQWFYNVVMIGYKLDIVDGYGDGTFKPVNSVSRAEFVKMFVETLLNN
jgi:hypothetical protein